MRLGMQLLPTRPSEYGNEFDTLLAVAQAAEQAGVDSVLMVDHFVFNDEQQPEKEAPVLECFLALSAIAAATSRIRVGQLVVGVPYRNPALVAKMCATLDVISHGRTLVGLGAAWHEQEFRAYGWPFPPLAERMDMLEEAAQIVDLMLTQQPVSFSGRHYTLRNAFNDPRPVQKPRPPIIIGGSGERRTLKIAARYADYCNVGGDPATVAHKYDVLRRHCETVGRPFEAITLCNNIGLMIGRDDRELAAQKERRPDFDGIIGTPQAVLDQIGAYAAVGSQYMTFFLPDAQDMASIQLLGERVLPYLENL